MLQIVFPPAAALQPSLRGHQDVWLLQICLQQLAPVADAYRYVTYWLEVTKTHTIAPPRALCVHQLVLRGLPQNLVHHAAITLGSRAIDGPIQPAAQYVFSLQPRSDLKLGG